MNSKYTILEWNLQRATNPDTIIKTLKDTIEKNDNIILIVLTDYPKAYENRDIKIKEKLEEKGYKFNYRTDISENENELVIFSKSKIELIETNKEMYCDEIKESNFARIGIKIKINNVYIKVFGIHLKNTVENKTAQVRQLISDIRENTPDIIIGDLNWNSAVADKNKPNNSELHSLIKDIKRICYNECDKKENCPKKRILNEINNNINAKEPVTQWTRNIEYKNKLIREYKPEELFCNLISEDKSQYSIWPDSDDNVYSHKDNRGQSCPDRVIWNSFYINMVSGKYLPDKMEGSIKQEIGSDHKICLITFEILRTEGN